MRKIVLIVLVLIMCVGMFACSGEDEGAKKDFEILDTDTLKETTTKSSAVGYIPGEYIKFGCYEQDNNLANGSEAIEWLVLEATDERALLISRYSLDCEQYNEEYVAVTWETCSLREWLNNDFINKAFTDTEKANIVAVTVNADDNAEYGVEAGNSTEDKVFLLSIDEVNKYFTSDSERESKPTVYAAEKGVWVSDEGDFKGNCVWWLRSPGEYQTRAAYVRYDGNVRNNGDDVRYADTAIRPALWINLNSLK